MAVVINYRLTPLIAWNCANDIKKEVYPFFWTYLNEYTGIDRTKILSNEGNFME